MIHYRKYYSCSALIRLFLTVFCAQGQQLELVENTCCPECRLRRQPCQLHGQPVPVSSSIFHMYHCPVPVCTGEFWRCLHYLATPALASTCWLTSLASEICLQYVDKEYILSLLVQLVRNLVCLSPPSSSDTLLN